MDDFLDNYELVGNKIKPVMPGETPLDKLHTLRQVLDSPRIDLTNRTPHVVDADELEDPVKERWDCETILCAHVLFY